MKNLEHRWDKVALAINCSKHHFDPIIRWSKWYANCKPFHRPQRENCMRKSYSTSIQLNKIFISHYFWTLWVFFNHFLKIFIRNSANFKYMLPWVTTTQYEAHIISKSFYLNLLFQIDANAIASVEFDWWTYFMHLM